MEIQPVFDIKFDLRKRIHYVSGKASNHHKVTLILQEGALLGEELLENFKNGFKTVLSDFTQHILMDFTHELEDCKTRFKCSHCEQEFTNFEILSSLESRVVESSMFSWLKPSSVSASSDQLLKQTENEEDVIQYIMDVIAREKNELKCSYPLINSNKKVQNSFMFMRNAILNAKFQQAKIKEERNVTAFVLNDNINVSIGSEYDLKKQQYCDICSKSFKYERIFEIHSCIKKNFELFCCFLCPRKFFSLRVLMIHERTHKLRKLKLDQIAEKKAEIELPQSVDKTSSLVDENQCSICFRAFRKLIYLIDHQRNAHPQFALNSMSKNSCNRFKSPQISQSSNGSVIFCNICGQTFQNAYLLRKHQCSCGRGPTNRKIKNRSTFNSNRHFMINAIEMEKSKCQCRFCDLTFYSINSLRIHQRIHVAKTNFFPCCQCSKSFGSFKQLTQHERVSHTKSVTIGRTRATKSCSICKKNFSSSGSRIRHERRCHVN